MKDKIEREVVSPSEKYKYVICERDDISFITIYELFEDLDINENISYGTYWSRKNDRVIIVDRDMSADFVAINELRNYIGEPNKNIEIDWIRDYSFSKEVCFVDPNKVKVFYEQNNHQTGQMEYNPIDAKTIIKITDIYLVEENGDEDEWQMGLLRDGEIICWDSYGDIKNAIKSL